jgi:plastocyanin
MTKMVAFGKWLAILTLVLAIIGVEGCSSNANSNTTAAPNTGLTTNPAGNTGTSTTGNAVTINISAKNMAFDTAKISVPAGANVTIVFTNNDAGIQHNVAIYFDSTAAKTIYKGKIITGVNKVTDNFTAPSSPGTYFFRCDVHPTSMTGDFVVTPITQ